MEEEEEGVEEGRIARSVSILRSQSGGEERGGVPDQRGTLRAGCAL